MDHSELMQTYTHKHTHALTGALRDPVESGGWHHWHSKPSAPIHDAGAFKLASNTQKNFGGGTAVEKQNKVSNKT